MICRIVLSSFLSFLLLSAVRATVTDCHVFCKLYISIFAMSTLQKYTIFKILCIIFVRAKPKNGAKLISFSEIRKFLAHYDNKV